MRLPFGFVLLCGLCVIQASRAADAANNTPSNVEELKRALALVLEETNTPGAGVAIVSRDEILVSEGVGLADRESQRKVTADTMFRAGSISKSFTAAAILKLLEAGQLDPQDPLSVLAPEVSFTNPWESTAPLRLVHALEHTTGFDEISLREFATSVPDSQLREALEFDPRPRTSRWPPGRFFSYSNANYTVAGYVVEKVSQQNFEEFLASEILEPLEMRGASFLLTDMVKNNLATGYGRDGSTPRAYEHIVGRSSGALNCTAEELSHFVQMLLNRGAYRGKRVLTPESVERMETPTASATARDGIRDGYGLANYTTLHKGHRIHGHAGAMDGYLASYGYSTEHGVGYALMLNSSNGAAFARLKKIILSFLARDWPEANISQPLAGGGDQLAQFEGYYEPHTLRFESSRFFDRLLAIGRIQANDGALHLKPLLGGSLVCRQCERISAFRSEDEPGPSILFFEEEGQMYLASVDLGLRGNYRRISAMQFWGQLFVIIYCIVVMISAIAFALVWLPRKLFGRMRGVQHLSVRVLPLLAVLSLIGFWGILFHGMTDAIPHLTRPTVMSVGIFVLSLIFAALTLAGIMQVYRGRRWELNRWVWRHALLVSAANAIVLAYLAYWGILGLRTWV